MAYEYKSKEINLITIRTEESDRMARKKNSDNWEEKFKEKKRTLLKVKKSLKVHY